MLAQRVISKGDGKVLCHKLIAPAAFTAVAMRIFIGIQQRLLLAAAAGRLRAILTLDLHAPLGRVVA